MRTLTGNTTDVEARDGVRSISLSRDGRTLAAATDEKVIRLWDAHTGDVKATLTGHTDSGAVVAFSRAFGREAHCFSCGRKAR